MNAIDTNVLVYRLDRAEPAKRAVAKQLLRELATDGETVLLWQVAGELMRQLSSWRHQGLIDRADSARYIKSLRRLFQLVLPVEAVLDRAARYADDFSLSHWDSMLVAACAEAGATTLYTEDMGAPRTIDVVQLINPF